MNAAALAPPPRRRGRPPRCPRDLALQVVMLRRQGLSYEQISAVLNAKGIPTPTGRPRWRKSSVDRLLHTRYVRDLIEEAGGC